ncbi:MAG: nucleotidyltransferase family protein [Clostridiales bacterium]|nr:nucleotidyltransferase family protein [Clostridiales bacterium]
MAVSEKSLDAAYGMVYLAACAVNNHIPDRERTEQMDLEKVYALSRFHGMTSLIGMAAESAFNGRLPDNPLFVKWDKNICQTVCRETLMDEERQELLAFFEERGIWYLPLKGIHLKELYPSPGMRQMADNDILFDKRFQPLVRQWFEERGYTVKSYNTGAHDVYMKEPFYSFEMHTSLFGFGHDPRWQAYYENVKERLVLDTGKSFGYHFSDEDFYIYNTVHAFKHFSGGGTGLRSLLDCYVYVQAHGDSLDWPYIEKELESLGAAEYEKYVRAVSLKAFSGTEPFTQEMLAGDEKEFFEEILVSGTYGTLDRLVRNKVKGLSPEEEKPSARTKLRYIWHRLFPGPEHMAMYHPFFAKHRWLVPAGYVYRFIYSGVKGFKRITSEFNTVRKM